MDVETLTTTHVCISLDNLLALAADGICVLTDDGRDFPLANVEELVKRERALGHQYFCDCDNRNTEGRCAGHQYRRCLFVMPYPGAAISVNHYRGRRKGGGYYVKAEARDWMDSLGWQIIAQADRLNGWRTPLEVTCDGRFQRGRAPDLSNLSKVTLDAIQNATGINDRDMRWHDGKRELCPKEMRPEIVITIREAK